MCVEQKVNKTHNSKRNPDENIYKFAIRFVSADGQAQLPSGL